MKLIRVKLLLFVSLLSIIPSLFCSQPGDPGDPGDPFSGTEDVFLSELIEKAPDRSEPDRGEEQATEDLFTAVKDNNLEGVRKAV